MLLCFKCRSTTIGIDKDMRVRGGGGGYLYLFIVIDIAVSELLLLGLMIFFALLQAQIGMFGE